MRSGKQKWPGAQIEEVDQVAGTADVAAHGANGFAERAHLDVYAAVAAEMVDGAASVAAEHSAGMRVVDHHDATVFLGEGAKFRQQGDVAVHGENAVGDDQLFAGKGSIFLKDAL